MNSDDSQELDVKPTGNQPLAPSGWSFEGINDGVTRRRFLKRTGAATAATIIAWHSTSMMAHALNNPQPGLSNKILVKICVEITVDTPIPAAEPAGGWQKWLNGLTKPDAGGVKRAEKKTRDLQDDDGGWKDPDPNTNIFPRERVAPDGLPTIKLIGGVPHVTAGTKLCLILKVRR